MKQLFQNLIFFLILIVHRNLLPRLGLRQGWKQALQSLTLRGVPTYLFSSGYGDVVAQVILQALYPSTAASSGVTGAGRR